ncbi:hypothetical protein H6P81_008529 [Aristolochia fimbriata]|uniref:Inner centromere protein ARK-binding domain-containing protein n=1 Tax=Aristolochia fimbriata TaxID=158543 RepID=A0AAV7EIY7_ARIFI|nr:hypothetical protein H6P81_008529 [Aristolochia fimbriata]
MSKVEKLFMQIFERRNWIVDQLKSQEESYDQSLASCLLVNGIEPPPWLLSEGFCNQNADLIELKKKLTTDTLLPQNPPHFQKDATYKQTNLEVDESLLRIQRSRSRQRALELRSSAKRERRKNVHKEDSGNEYIGRVTKSGSMNSELSTKIKFVIEAKQLDLDDTEECSSSSRFQEALEKEKADLFAEKRAIEQLEASHSSKGKNILDGFCERNALDAEQKMLEKAVLQSVDVPNIVEIALADSIEEQSKKQLELIENTSLKSNMSKNCGDDVDENCSIGKNMSNMITFTANNKSTLPEPGGKDGQEMEEITQTAAIDFLNPVLDRVVGKHNSETDVIAVGKVLETSGVSVEFMDKVVGEVSRCTPEQIEVESMLPSDCGYKGDATNGSEKSRNFHLIERSSSLEPRVPNMIEAEGIETGSIAPNSSENEYTRTLAEGSSKRCDQRKVSRYFLRSSTGHKMIVDSPKSNNSNIVSGKSKGAENVTDACVYAVGLSGTPCAAEGCRGPKEASELRDRHIDHHQSIGPGGFCTSTGSEKPRMNALEEDSQSFGPNWHHTPVESLRTSKSAGKPVVTPCSDICNELQDVPCSLRKSTSQNKNAGLSQSSVSVGLRNSLQLSLNVTNACEVSWPVNKRRKIKNGLRCLFHTSPRIGRKNLLRQISKENFIDHLSSDNSPVDLVEPHNCSISQGSDVGHFNIGSTSTRSEILSSKSKQESSDALTKLGSSSICIVEKEFLNIEGIVHQGSFSAAMENMEVEEMVENQQENAGTRNCLEETAAEVVGSSCTYQEMMRQPTSASDEALGKWPLSVSGEGRKEEKSLSAKNPTLSYYTTPSAYADDLETCPDEMLPELEGFSVSVSPACELPLVTGDGNGIDSMDLSCIKKDPPVFEQVDKSTSLPVPLSCPSVVDSMLDIKYSLPAELLLQMNLKHFNPLNGIDEKQFGASEDNFPTDIGSRISVEPSGNLLGKSYSFTPPVGKLTSKSTVSSLGKNSSLNLELTCFRIDEDSCIFNEESEIPEVVGPSENVMSSREVSTSHKGDVLAHVTSECDNTISLLSDTVKIRDQSSLASVNTDVNLKRSGSENGCWDQQIKNDDKENCGDSMYGYCARNTSRSLRNRPDKLKVSGKVSEAKGGQSYIDKASKPKNLVSNISSFVPLVQRKQQQPAILTGKRDIKVKALEAAEAAKRLQIERENARKTRKEAAKVEREKLEKENMRQLELKQKKKEEERKKKEADIAARKRQREEEEKKGKERKKRCIEEVRKQQQEREERLRAEKEENEMCRKEERKRKALSDEARRHHKMEKANEGNGDKKRIEKEKRPSKIMTDASNTCENSMLVDKPDSSEKVINDLDSSKLVGDGFSMNEEALQPQSYEISPYQPSDCEEEEEEEEEDEVPERKFIPEWAREKSIARSLDFLQHFDPDNIFLPERCCNIDEMHQKR